MGQVVMRSGLPNLEPPRTLGRASQHRAHPMRAERTECDREKAIDTSQDQKHTFHARTLRLQFIRAAMALRAIVIAILVSACGSAPASPSAKPALPMPVTTQSSKP